MCPQLDSRVEPAREASFRPRAVRGESIQDTKIRALFACSAFRVSGFVFRAAIGHGFKRQIYQTNRPEGNPGAKRLLKTIVSLGNSHTNATIIGWHLWEIDLRFALNSTAGWQTKQQERRTSDSPCLTRRSCSGAFSPPAPPRVPPSAPACNALAPTRRPEAPQEADAKAREPVQSASAEQSRSCCCILSTGMWGSVRFVRSADQIRSFRFFKLPP